MKKIAVSLIAHKGAEKELFEEGKRVIQEIFPIDNVDFTNLQTDVLFVLSGGSENEAKQLISKDKPLLILASPSNNSHAAATEIKAYCNHLGLPSIMLNLAHKEFKKDALCFIAARQALESLKNQKLGLLGNVSDWLIISDIEKELLDKKFGIQLKQFNWNNYRSFENHLPNEAFLEHFKEKGSIELSNASKVYSLLKEIVEKENLDAITV